MRKLSDVMSERTEQIRNDPIYRHNLAMRDEPDYSHDEQEPVPEVKVIYEHTQVTEKALQEMRSLRSDVESIKARFRQRPPDKSSDIVNEADRVDITDRLYHG